MSTRDWFTMTMVRCAKIANTAKKKPSVVRSKLFEAFVAHVCTHDIKLYYTNARSKSHRTKRILLHRKKAFILGYVKYKDNARLRFINNCNCDAGDCLNINRLVWGSKSFVMATHQKAPRRKVRFPVWASIKFHHSKPARFSRRGFSTTKPSPPLHSLYPHHNPQCATSTEHRIIYLSIFSSQPSHSLSFSRFSPHLARDCSHEVILPSLFGVEVCMLKVGC